MLVEVWRSLGVDELVQAVGFVAVPLLDDWLDFVEDAVGKELAGLRLY